MSAQISNRAQASVNWAALNNQGRLANPRTAQELRKLGLAVQRDGLVVLSRRGWSLVSEWVLKVVGDV